MRQEGGASGSGSTSAIPGGRGKEGRRDELGKKKVLHSGSSVTKIHEKGARDGRSMHLAYMRLCCILTVKERGGKARQGKSFRLVKYKAHSS